MRQKHASLLFTYINISLLRLLILHFFLACDPKRDSAIQWLYIVQSSTFKLESERDCFNRIYSVCLIQLWQPFVASFCDTCNACVLCSSGPHQAIRLPRIPAPLIYVFPIKSHGLHRSAVTFLYSHRHSWRTAGWSGKRFMTQTLPGSLKLWQALPPSLPLLQPDFLPSSSRPTKSQRKEVGAANLVWFPIEPGHTFDQSCCIKKTHNKNMDTTDTWWCFSTVLEDLDLRI